MKLMPRRTMAAVVALTYALTTAGCVTPPQQLYYWGNYQPETYSYFKNSETPQEQIVNLEKTVQEAQAANRSLPPGFSAHLGMLYLASGQADKAQSAFQMEQTRFPESAAYMDFLLRKKPQITSGGDVP
ncbi:DUF4810 domain-containing protein [Stagnimonas aquatica]|uniref:DUF4810 domain-containing protein n=1 Tax=Stagnimonas aquatica TaxID=2689987 RepID=A0A3N0VMH3_9GAMM|nr:DUF4810 domain-containing protein [Stagnimonas aquatica]ROH93770.1 DUF4810 domain-containing protein [Stagnimonas aquatica]